MSSTSPTARPGLRRTDLTQGPIFSVLLKFALPLLASNVLQSLNGSINALWVGRLLGEEALTATSNANLILFFLLGVVFGVGMASTILVGQAVGRRDLDGVKRVIGTTTTFFVVTSVFVAAAGYLLTPKLLALMNTPAVSRQMAEDYLRIIFLALPSAYLFTFVMMALRGVGDSRTPFFFMLMSAVLDVTLNPLLILGVGPLPRLGVAGAATSTLFAQGVSLLSMVVYLYVRKSDIRLEKHELKYLTPDFGLLKAMFVKGLPMGLQMAVISSSAMVMMGLINGYGARVTAAYGVDVQLWTYVQMPAMAIGAAASSMAAQNVGAGKWDRVERTAWAGIGVNVILTGALVAALFFVDRALISLFLPADSNAVGTAVHIDRISAWSFVLFGVMFVVFGVVRSTGAVLAPLVILTLTLFGVRVSFAEVFEPHFGADAIWWSFPLSMTASMILALAYYRWGPWRSARMAPARPVEDAPSTGAGTPALEPVPADKPAGP